MKNCNGPLQARQGKEAPGTAYGVGCFCGRQDAGGRRHNIIRSIALSPEYYVMSFQSSPRTYEVAVAAAVVAVTVIFAAVLAVITVFLLYHHHNYHYYFYD